MNPSGRGAHKVKLLTFEKDGQPKLGALTAKGVVDLTGDGSDPAFASMQALIEGGGAALERAEAHTASASEFIDPASVTWLAPLPLPMQIRDCSGFREHFRNATEAAVKIMISQADDPAVAEQEIRERAAQLMSMIEKRPVYYKANRFAVTGPETDVVWPSYSQLMDFELELGCVIGRKGKNISKQDARDHIFGLTIFNDFSARDTQVEENPTGFGPTKSKDFDASVVLGPVIVTMDEIGDAYDLRMQARVNGETLCDSSSSTMNWRFEDVIEFVSREETLHPGEVLGSGTVGWGCGLEHLRFLNAGDVVELEVEKIGVLRNRVLRP